MKLVTAGYAIFFGAVIGGGGLLASMSDIPAMVSDTQTPAARTATAAPYYTPTIPASMTPDAQSTVYVAQTAIRATEAYLDNVNLQIIQADNAALELRNAEAQIALDNRRIDEQMFSAGISASQTAYAPAATVTQAALELQLSLIDSRRLQPTLTVANAKAEAYAANAEWVLMVELGIKSILVVMAYGIFIYLFFSGIAGVITSIRKSENQTVPATATPPAPLFIASATNPQQSRRIDTAIPCKAEQFIELARGVIAERKTLAFNQWTGTRVHRSIDALREWFLRNRFAVEVHDGELMIIEDGKHLLKETYTMGTIPPPYTCEE